MPTFRPALFAAALAGALAACNASAPSLPPLLPHGAVRIGAPVIDAARSCATVRLGDTVRCDALVRTDLPPAVSPDAQGIPGFGPRDLRSAYALDPSAGGGQTIAIVDAYDDPNAEADMAVYRRHFHIRPCTAANGCFRKVGQGGGTSLPHTDGGWSEEISLDLDMASATCPKCRILLVEAKAATLPDLGTAVDTAVALGANVASNSYGQPEQGSSDKHFVHPGTILVASSGDNGTASQQPCSYGMVVCVGGTTLVRASNARGWHETAWNLGGSGCSGFIRKPRWQTDKGCSSRSAADVSAVADPHSGVAVYDSFPYNGLQGWLEFGGTSAAAPIVASIYGLAGNAASLDAAQSLWQHLGTTALHDVTKGSNGSCAALWSYICAARTGYDGPTGVGTPNGIAAF